MRQLGIFLALLSLHISTAAQQLAYVYIQGDKQLPFYVKLEGAMQERYGKNYCILPQMAPGPAHLEILFQQNTYPAQQFTILVPEGGSRGFLLTRQNGAFALYDLQQQFYLPAGNREEDDHLSSHAAAVAPAATPADALPEPLPPAPGPKTARHRDTARKARTARQLGKAPSATTDRQPANTSGFIDHIAFNNNGEGPVATMPARSQDGGLVPTVRLAPDFRNSDCPAPMDSTVFEQLYKQMMTKRTDEERIDFLNGQMDKCYLSWHARTLGTMLSEDAARYTFLKKVYPRIVDQQAFPLLDDMLRSEVWKAQFNQFIHP